MIMNPNGGNIKVNAVDDWFDEGDDSFFNALKAVEKKQDNEGEWFEYSEFFDSF